MRRLQNRSLLEVNEDFGDKYNDKRAFLVNLFVDIIVTNESAININGNYGEYQQMQFKVIFSSHLILPHLFNVTQNRKGCRKNRQPFLIYLMLIKPRYGDDGDDAHALHNPRASREARGERV